jgi:hypothetical protein
MPKIQQLNLIEIDPKKFLDACSPQELIEVDILLSSSYYQSKMNQENSSHLAMMQIPGK